MNNFPPLEQWELEHVDVPATAGNVEYNLPLDTGFRIQLLYGFISIVCDANPANRYIECSIETNAGARLFPPFRNATAYTAGQTRVLAFMKHLESMTDIAVFGANALAIIDEGYIIDGDDNFNIAINGGLAGDSYSGIITYLKIKL